MASRRGQKAARRQIREQPRNEAPEAFPWKKSLPVTILWIIVFAAVWFGADRGYGTMIRWLFPVPQGLQFVQVYGVTLAIVLNGLAPFAQWLPVIGLFWLVRDPLPGQPRFPRPRLPTWRGHGLTIAVAGAVVISAFSYIWTPIAEAMGLPNPDDVLHERQILGAIKAGRIWLWAIFSVMIVPILEEVVFRGIALNILQSSMARYPKLRSPGAIVVNSALFATLHEWNRFVEIFVVGAIFCGIYRKSGRLSASIGAHALCNLWHIIDTAMK